MSPLGTPAERIRATLHLAVFLAVSCLIVLAAYRSYSEESTLFTGQVHDELSQIASLKLNEIYAWQAERRGDAQVAGTTASLMPDIQQVLASSPAKAAIAHSTAWLDQMRSSYRYSGVALLDRRGKIRLQSGELFASPGFYENLVLTSGARDVTFTFYVRNAQVSRAHWVITSRLRAQSGEILGDLLLCEDPWKFPFPLILKWPISANSGILYIMRASEGKLLSFSSAEHEQLDALDNNASFLVQAYKTRNGPSDVAASSGDTLGSVRTDTIGSSPVSVLATVNRAAAFVPLARVRGLFILVTALIVVICGAGVGWIWRDQVLQSYRQRLEAEQKHRALVGHYDYLTRFANDAFFLATADGSFVQVNERATDFYGYTRDEFLTLNVHDLRAPNTKADHERARVQLESTGSIVYESIGIRKDGSSFPTELSVRLIEIEGVTYRQTIVRDITERRRAAVHIDRLNRLYAVLSRCGQTIVKAETEETLFKEVCHVAVESGGFRVAAIRIFDRDSNQPLLKAASGEAVPYLKEAEDRNAKTGKPSDLRSEPVINHELPPAGSGAGAPITPEERWNVGSSLAVPLWRGGAIAGDMRLYAAEPAFFDAEQTELAMEIAESVSFALESLERKRKQQSVESELRLNRERLELVLDAANEAYWDWNLETGEIERGPQYDLMLGYGPFELPRSRPHWLSMIHPEDRERMLNSAGLFTAPDAVSGAAEYRLRRKSGEYIWVYSRGKVVGRKGGQPARVVGTLADITARKKLEEQFRQAQKLESVGRLAGGIAHDFNNLLTVITGYCKLLIMRIPARDSSHRYLEEIQKAGYRAAELVAQLLTFSRKTLVEPRVLRVNEIVSDSESMLRRLLPENIELSTELAAPRDCCLADPNQIHQVLMNLVVNATDAMPSGGRLRIRTENVSVSSPDVVDADKPSASSFLLLSVEDTGVGMDPETIRNIFEPFFTTKEVGKGTGLGLSTVYGIVRQCGGFIQVDSLPGKGSSFRVYFPICSPGSAQEPAPESTSAASLRGNETILVVEDQESVRDYTAETLRTFGYNVVTACSGEEALSLARQHRGPIHVLLSDFVMPSMSGAVLAERMHELRPATKAVFMSGYSDDRTGGANSRNLNSGYLQKPFSPEDLALAIRKRLGKAAQRRNILVVEDQDSVREFLADVLSDHHSVLLAGDGAEAIQLIRSNNDIDVVITDLVMPRQEGVETIRVLRRAYPQIKIVAMSGAFGGQFLRTARLLGADATLAKPIQPEMLLETLENLFV